MIPPIGGPGKARRPAAFRRHPLAANSYFCGARPRLRLIGPVLRPAPRPPTVPPMPDSAPAPAKRGWAADVVHSACPHDCPSVCALEVERLDTRRIGRVRGAAENPYTAGVVCAKV